MPPRFPRVTTGWALALAAVITMAAPAMADDSAGPLTAAVMTVRGASRCAPLASDALVQRAADMATHASSDYIAHRSAAVPFTDPMPALKTIGYTGAKALLFSGYGANEADAIHGLILQGRNAIPDCSYTQYGASSLRGDDGSILTAVVLAAP
jgi:hypothetical protein